MGYRYLVAVFVLAVGRILQGQCVPQEHSARTETFSTVKEVSGQGSAGSELTLQEQHQHVIAQLKDYRGSSLPVITNLEGHIEETKPTGTQATKCSVQLTGKDKQGVVEIEGEITPAYFYGVITRHIGKDVLTFRISLRRQVPEGDINVGRLRAIKSNYVHRDV
jgi:hypothetical protein